MDSFTKVDGQMKATMKPIVSVKFVHLQGSCHLACPLKPLLQGSAESLRLNLDWWIITTILFCKLISYSFTNRACLTEFGKARTKQWE